jgi:hypothetical protein
VAIDGTVQGNIQPGGNGLTRSVSVGQHSVSATATAIAFGWAPAIHNVPTGGFSLTLSCP